MSIQFQMTQKEYIAALKFKNKMLSKNRINAGVLMLLLVFAAAVLLLIFDSVQSAALMAFVFVLCCFLLLIKNKVQKETFKASPLLNTAHLITLNKGLEITNSFEKIICPDFNIFAAAQTGEYLFIIATPRKGCFCINKSRYSSPALDSLISSLRCSGKMKGDI